MSAGSDPHAAGGAAAEVVLPGRRRKPQARPEGSAPHAVTSVGAKVFPPSHPKEKCAPLGGSAVHAVTSVGAIFTWPVRVYWEDTDAGGIVFYANYLKFFERARTEWLRSLGIEQQALRAATGGMFVVVDTQVRYHRPARLDDQLLVTARAPHIGRACMTIAQQAIRGSEPSGDLLCDASIRIGWVSGPAFKPARIPPHILDALQ